jgi:hypothetical protein
MEHRPIAEIRPATIHCLPTASETAFRQSLSWATSNPLDFRVLIERMFA